METASRMRLYGEETAPFVLVQPMDEQEIGDAETECAQIRERTSVPFCLAVFAVTDWNTELSPWNALPVFGKIPFGSAAEDTLAVLLAELQTRFAGRTLLIGGYSLAGLFALWAAYRTNAFRGAAAVSPSVWFPNWIDFAKTNPPKAQRIYLSLGDREERAKNPTMARVGDCIRTQYDLLQTGGTPCTLEWNAGNHFQDAPLRTAKGFAWLLHQFKEQENGQ